jgi:GrpB-like predicted nucleotidyltransferase (UPF0157 family)
LRDPNPYVRSPDPAECGRYAALKRKLAPLLATAREAYVTGKAGLVTEMLKLARQPALQQDGHNH